MSTISSTAGRREAGHGSVGRTAATALKRWWVAYINWRIDLLAATRSSSRPRSRGGRGPGGRGLPRARLAGGGEHRAVGGCC